MANAPTFAIQRTSDISQTRTRAISNYMGEFGGVTVSKVSKTTMFCCHHMRLITALVDVYYGRNIRVSFEEEARAEILR